MVICAPRKGMRARANSVDRPTRVKELYEPILLSANSVKPLRSPTFLRIGHERPGSRRSPDFVRKYSLFNVYRVYTEILISKSKDSIECRGRALSRAINNPKVRPSYT